MARVSRPVRVWWRVLTGTGTGTSSQTLSKPVPSARVGGSPGVICHNWWLPHQLSPATSSYVHKQRNKSERLGVQGTPVKFSFNLVTDYSNHTNRTRTPTRRVKTLLIVLQLAPTSTTALQLPCSPRFWQGNPSFTCQKCLVWDFGLGEVVATGWQWLLR